MVTIGRRAVFRLLAGSALAEIALPCLGRASGRVVTIGIDLSLTGADAETAILIRGGLLLAIDEANARGGPAGIHVNVLMLDDSTTTAGQHDPAQGATNARKMVADPNCVVALGPMSSTPGKAMAAILSGGGLATITPTSTDPDITDPLFAGLYRPAGKPIYFRTVTTDAYQGPSLANYFAVVHKVRSMYSLDDSGAYGVGLCAAFEAQAKRKGVTAMGHDRLDPKAFDYTAVLTKVKSLNPQLLFYAGDAQAGVKLAKQAYDIIPAVMKAGSGMYSPSFLGGAGFPAAQGWYATTASPHMIEDAKMRPFVQKFVAKNGRQPSDYSMTAYDAALVALNAIKQVARSGKPITRSAVRDAIQATRLETLQGEVSFDANGDLTSHAISVFQVQHNPNFPLDDVAHQYKYIGAASQEAA